MTPSEKNFCYDNVLKTSQLYGNDNVGYTATNKLGKDINVPCKMTDKETKRNTQLTCKDCLHYEACDWWIKCGDASIGDLCDNFSDKSEWVHLPCKVGDNVYLPFVNDTIEGIITQVNLHGFYLGNVCYSWDSISKLFFITKESAEKALAERNKNDIN